ncbi:ABC transporter permease [Maricaulis maris]|jgi:ABC-2 type transport system permease protein|nr:ABC transporter permease [Maricaulis maris]
MYALADFKSALSGLDRWAYLGVKRLQIEYRRPLIGSLWIVLGFATSAIGIGVLLSSLLGVPASQHVPYVAFGFAVWNFISTSVVAGCSVLVANRSMLLQMRAPRTAFVLVHVVRNGVLLLLCLITASFISLAFGWRPTLEVFAALPGLVLVIATAVCTTTVFGLVAARMPDFTEIVGSVMRLSFFFTPIIWIPDRRSNHLESAGFGEGFLYYVYTYNPFTYFLNIVRQPILGEPTAATDWIVASSICCVMMVASICTLQAYGRRITYWL